MAGKVIIHGCKQNISAQIVIKFDSQIVGEVKSYDQIEIPIEKDCDMTCKVGLNPYSKKSIRVKDGMCTVIQLSVNRLTGAVTMEIIKEEIYNSTGDVKEDSSEEKPVFELDGGVGDILIVYEDRLIIRHKGALNFLAMGIKGDKTLYYSDITSVQYKVPGRLSGHIQFSLPGGLESTGGVMAASADENTVTITGKDGTAIIAEKVVEFINQKIREYKTSKNGSTTVIQQTSSADELKKFKELLDMGIITQEEFDAKKKQLLGL